METHDSHGVPVVTFGSGAGYFKTGLYCDYRNQGDPKAAITPYNDTGDKYHVVIDFSGTTGGPSPGVLPGLP